MRKTFKQHSYNLCIDWTGNDGEGTKTYRSYRRDYVVMSDGKTSTIEGSSDPAFRGDPRRFNPEELLLASLSSCHMLSYLHLCAVQGVIVLEYQDQASGVMEETDDGSGSFTGVQLRPRVRIADGGNVALALSAHHEAHRVCFIARSVNFTVEVVPQVVVGP